jgi:ribosomal protein S18 acetylase RimI-like enzyme
VTEEKITIREATPADALGIAIVHINIWRSTYRGIVPVTFLDNMSYEEGEKRWRSRLSIAQAEGKIAFFVAEDVPGHIVGYISGGYNREEDPVYTAELYAIYILQEYHGQGIGRRLTRTFVEKMLTMGIDSMLLWVFSVNPARKFYEALGGQLLRTSTFEIEGVTIDEVAYGWSNIRTLLEEPSP